MPKVPAQHHANRGNNWTALALKPTSAAFGCAGDGIATVHVMYMDNHGHLEPLVGCQRCMYEAGGKVKATRSSKGRLSQPQPSKTGIGELKVQWSPQLHWLTSKEVALAPRPFTAALTKPRSFLSTAYGYGA